MVNDPHSLTKIVESVHIMQTVGKSAGLKQLQSTRRGYLTTEIASTQVYFIDTAFNNE